MAPVISPSASAAARTSIETSSRPSHTARTQEPGQGSQPAQRVTVSYVRDRDALRASKPPISVEIEEPIHHLNPQACLAEITYTRWPASAAAVSTVSARSPCSEQHMFAILDALKSSQSSLVRGTLPSTTTNKRSASSCAARVRLIPSCSTIRPFPALLPYHQMNQYPVKINGFFDPHPSSSRNGRDNRRSPSGDGSTSWTCRHSGGQG